MVDSLSETRNKIIIINLKIYRAMKKRNTCLVYKHVYKHVLGFGWKRAAKINLKKVME